MKSLVLFYVTLIIIICPSNAFSLEPQQIKAILAHTSLVNEGSEIKSMINKLFPKTDPPLKILAVGDTNQHIKADSTYMRQRAIRSSSDSFPIAPLYKEIFPEAEVIQTDLAKTPISSTNSPLQKYEAFDILQETPSPHNQTVSLVLCRKGFCDCPSNQCMHIPKEKMNKALSNIGMLLKPGGHALISLRTNRAQLWRKALKTLKQQPGWETTFIESSRRMGISLIHIHKKPHSLL